MEDSQTLSIANTILQQIQFCDRWFLPAIGAKNFLALPSSKNFQGGVRFTCNGLKHKGIVEISLRWVDDYQVSFINKKGVEVKNIQGVYCDMLVEVLDWVEGK